MPLVDEFTLLRNKRTEPDEFELLRSRRTPDAPDLPLSGLPVRSRRIAEEQSALNQKVPPMGLEGLIGAPPISILEPGAEIAGKAIVGMEKGLEQAGERMFPGAFEEPITGRPRRFLGGFAAMPVEYVGGLAKAVLGPPELPPEGEKSVITALKALPLRAANVVRAGLPGSSNLLEAVATGQIKEQAPEEILQTIIGAGLDIPILAGIKAGVKPRTFNKFEDLRTIKEEFPPQAPAEAGVQKTSLRPAEPVVPQGAGENVLQETIPKKPQVVPPTEGGATVIASPPPLKTAKWIRGVNQTNTATGDKFFTTSREVADNFSIAKTGDKPKFERLSEEPKNPLIVEDKNELAETVGYKGDPLAEPKGLAVGERFDELAKRYAQEKGHDGIIYQSGTFDKPELHLFEKTAQLEQIKAELKAPSSPLPPTVKTPLPTMGGGLGFARGGPYLVESQKIQDAIELSKNRPKVQVVVSQPKKTPFSGFNRTPDVFRRLSPELGKKADDAFIWETESRQTIKQDNALADQAWKGLNDESKERIRDVIEAKLKPEDLTPLERQRLPLAEKFNENMRQTTINEILRPPLIRGLTNPRRKVVLDAANQPTAEAAAEFVRKADHKSYGARQPFSEDLAETASEYRDMADWGMDDYFHRLYEGELRMLVKKPDGSLETIGFAKDVRDGQVKLDEWIEKNPAFKAKPLELTLFNKRSVPIELRDILGKEAFKKWVAAVEGKGKEIKLKTSRAGFFAAVNKLAREGELDRDVAGETVAQALYPRPVKRKIASLKTRKLEHELLGLADPERTQRALSWSIRRKIFADKTRSNFEAELTKIKDMKTRRFIEDQIDEMVGHPTELDQFGRDAAEKMNLPPRLAEQVANGIGYYQTLRLIGGTRQFRFALLNSTQKLNIWNVFGEKHTGIGMKDAKWSYKPGTWQNKLWEESGLANIPTKFEGTNLPIAARALGKTGEVASEIGMFMVKHSELDNWRDTFFSALSAAKAKGLADPKKTALLAVRDLQFPRTPTADVPILRGRLFSQTIGQFQSFNLSQLNYYRKILKGEKVSDAQITSAWGARARAFASFWASGGIRAISSPIIAVALKYGVLTSTAIWIDNLYEDIKKKFGERAANTVFFGVPGGVAGVDISGSVGINVPFLSPRFDFRPPIISTITNIGKDFPRKEFPQFYSPETDVAGRKAPPLTLPEEIGKALGFQPARVRGLQIPMEAKQIEDKAEREGRKEAINGYADARQAGDAEAAKAIRLQAIKKGLFRTSDDFLESYRREAKLRRMSYEKRREKSLLRQNR